MALRMTFGGAPCPSLWGYISDTIADLANALIQHKQWNQSILRDKISDSIPTPERLPPDTPFKQAKDLAVEIPTNDLGKVDIYLDDFIVVTPDLLDNGERANAAVPLAIRTITRPINKTDALPRNDIIARKKLIAEGTMAESKTILGWVIDTRTLTISLPMDKNKKWITDLQTLLESKKANQGQLETTVGRLNHTANVIPMLRHFLGRIRHALARSIKHKWTCLSLQEKSDISLMIEFLRTATKGISINNLVFRKPTLLYRSDASEFGIGGYNLSSGKAWRFEIPESLRLRTSLNSLEFIACVITIWIDSIHKNIESESCILSQSDSSSATGWLRKSNFADSNTNEIVQMITARHLASIILKSNSCLYSQWFAGDENVVADSLSRDFHIPDEILTSLIKRSTPQQVPFGFQINPLPKEIVSWLTNLLQNLPEKERWSKQPTRSKISHGLDSNHISFQLELPTHTYPTSLHTHVIRYLEPSDTLSERADFILRNTNLVKQDQLEPPWTMWHRPTDWPTGPTQDLILMENLRSFYNAN